MTCSFAKFGCSFGIFLNSANLICRNTDISKCFRGSLRLRDNESRLYYDETTEKLAEIPHDKMFHAIRTEQNKNFIRVGKHVRSQGT